MTDLPVAGPEPPAAAGGFRRRLAGALGLLALYGGAVAWLTWPLAAEATRSLPDTRTACRFDTLYSAWVLAWESHAIATAPARLAAANIYYPARHALFYGPTAFGALPYFAPVYLLSGNPALALNLLFLGSVALTAWSLHLVVRRWTGSHAGGAVAAATFLTTRWVLWEWLPTAPHAAVLAYLPVIMLLAARAADRRAGGALLVMLVVVQSLTDQVYVAPAVLLPLGVLALARLARSRTRGAGIRLLAALAVATVLLIPTYAGFIAVRMENPNLPAQSVWPLRGAAPLRLPWGLRESGPVAVQPVVLLLIGAGALGAALGRRRAPADAWRHGTLWVVTGLLIAIPRVSWGHTVVTLPLGLLLRWLPALALVRVPLRLGVAALLGLALLAGAGFTECAARIPGGTRARVGRAVLAVLLIGIMYAEYARDLPAPHAYPLHPAMDGAAPILEALRQQSGPIVEVPASVAPADAAEAMYRSLFHWRPLLNGYSSYWPAGFPERMHDAARLLDPPSLAALRALGLTGVLVHTGEFSPSERDAWFAVAAAGGSGALRLRARDGSDVLFAVVPAATD